MFQHEAGSTGVDLFDLFLFVSALFIEVSYCKYLT